MSMSTLRRRIKAGEIEFKFLDGKYFIKDGPSKNSSGSETIAPPTPMSHVQWTEKAKTIASAPTASPQTSPSVTTISAAVSAPVAPTQDGNWDTTQALLAEIKKAYSLILQEKEEQILQLKEEVSDLKTLVRVLEDETLRPQSRTSAAKSDFDLDLELGLDV